MSEPNYDNILKAKIDHYGETRAAYQFAAEEYARQWFVWMLQQMEHLQWMKPPTNEEIIAIHSHLHITAPQSKNDPAP